MDETVRARATYDLVGGGEWSTTPPTEPGWYWVYDGNFNVPGIKLVEIVKYWDKLPDDVPAYYLSISGEGYGWDLKELIKRDGLTHWLGPLPVPAPPE